MADNEQVSDSGTQEQAPIVESSPSNVESAAPAESQTTAPVAEKMIPQSQVSKIAAREAREAAEKARNEERARYERERQQSQQASQPQSIGGIQQQSPDQIRQMIQEEAWKMSQHAVAQKIEQDWLSTMNAEKHNDPEFAELYDDLGIEDYPGLVLAMQGMDNKAAVVKDLAKNPSKFANILMLAGQRNPKLAEKELNKLSASIKANEEAQKQPKVDAPLGQLKSSNIGTDNGDMTVSDFRLMFRG